MSGLAAHSVKSSDDVMYSDTLDDPALQDQVRRIRARHDNAFGTKAYKEDEESPWPVRWAEAKSDEFGRWTVKLKKAMPPKLTGPQRQALTGDEALDVVIEPQTILKDVCFFDALHYCYRFENFESEYGIVDPARSHARHYADVADDEGIPFDESGEPVPAANGEILLDRRMTESEIEKSEKSAGNMAESFAGKSRALTQVAADDSQKLVSGLQERETNLRALKKAAAVNARLMAIFNESVTKGFQKCHHQYDVHKDELKENVHEVAVNAVIMGTPLGGIGGSAYGLATAASQTGQEFFAVALLFSIPVSALVSIGFIKYGENRHMEWIKPSHISDSIENIKNMIEHKKPLQKRFAKELAGYKNAVKALPDGAMKDDLQRFAGEVDVVYYALAARKYFNTAQSKPSRGNEKRKNKALQSFADAATRAHLPQDVAEVLLTDIASYKAQNILGDDLIKNMKSKGDSLKSLMKDVDAANVNEVLALGDQASSAGLMESKPLKALARPMI